MVKSSFKQKVIQSIIFGFTYAMMMALFEKSTSGEINILKFLISGLFFGIIMGFIVPMISDYFNKKALSAIQVELNDNEKVLLESRANFNRGIGKIILTNERLLYVEKDKLASQYIEILNHNIKEVKPKSTIGFIHNKFIVTTESRNYEFIVYENERNLWVTSISNTI